MKIRESTFGELGDENRNAGVMRNDRNFDSGMRDRFETEAGIRDEKPKITL